MSKARSVYLFTNRVAAVFGENGEQMGEYQAAISCYAVDSTVAQRVLDEATRFYVAKWGEWTNPITKKEMEYLLGLRTPERDLAEQRVQNEQQRTG